MPHVSQKADNLTPEELRAQANAKAELHAQIVANNLPETDEATKAREAGFIARAAEAEAAARGTENA